MKIVCGSCQAKYSIADEKVAGKVFKIRCKRCGEVIVVHGDQDAGAAAPAAAAAYDTGADAVWHVVINGEQAGPYSPAQLGEMLTNGQVDWEAYVWCEGFDNWAAMRDVPDLVAAITGQGQPAAQAQPAAFAAQPSMGADPFADDGGGGGGLFAEPAAAAAPARSNLFGGGSDSPFDGGGGGGGGGVVASAPSPRVSTEQAMTGARNENSVLFSLKNLQALATGGSAPAAAGGPAPMSAGNRPGFAGGDGSGLIDIRALASATGMADSRREEAEKDALLSLGSNQTGAFGALGSPMLAPVSNDDGGSKKGLIFAIIGGFAMLAAAGVVAAVLLRPQAPPGQVGVAAPVAPPPAAAVAAAANPQAAPAEPAEAPSEGELAAKKAAATNAPSEEKRASSSGATRRKESSGDSKPSSADSDLLAAKPAAAEEKPKPKGGSSSIDDLLEGAIGGGSKPAAKKEAAPAVNPNLPEKPSRDDVINAMNSVKDAVTACGKGAGGVAFANVTVSGKTGRVTTAEITGITGEVGSCIARAVRKANFGKFQSDTFQVKYPFRL